MNRTMFWSLAVLASVAFGAVSYFDDDTQPALAPIAVNEPAAAIAIENSDAMAVFDTAPADPVATAEDSAQRINHLAADARSDNVEKRAAAIGQLALAPRALAIPVLQDLLSGTAEEDRQLALNALHTLALDQGDADGAIREVLRLTIYDGDDAVVASNALIILNAIEQAAADS